MEDFVKERLEICKNCAIMRMTEFGMKCDDRKWLDPINNISSFLKKDGYKRGCGCYLSSKTKNRANNCPCGKW